MENDVVLATGTQMSRDELDKKAGPLPIITIYAQPTDYPEHFVARLFAMDKPTEYIWLSRTLEPLRETARQLQLTHFPRNPEDDPVIVESWL